MDRRTWLQGVAGSVAAGIAASTAGCGSGGAVDPRTPPPPPHVPPGRMEVPIAQVPVGARTRVCFQDVPVEVVRTGNRVTARILVCTHWGCTVTWVAEHYWYQCPCHDGKFDEDGEVKVGPPQKALLEVPAALHGDVIVLGS